MGKSYEAATLFMLKSAGYESGANNVVKSNDKIASSNKKWQPLQLLLERA